MNIKPTGKIQPLPISVEPLQDMSIDFIEGLPKLEGCDVIMVEKDHLHTLCRLNILVQQLRWLKKFGTMGSSCMVFL
jgi:hypothetical protein